VNNLTEKNFERMTKKKSYWPEGYSDQTFFDAMGGDEESINMVILAFTPMIHMWAHEYIYLCNRDYYEDLVQEGVIGVIKAIKTFDRNYNKNGREVKPCTWVWWKIRAAVKGAAKKLSRHSKNSIDFTSRFDGVNMEDLQIFSYRENELPSLDIESLLIDGCGSLDCRGARIVRDKFGLLGSVPLKHGEVAKKHGVSKQTANNHVVRFISKIRSKYPELKEMIP
jgi:RNA polymerase sigma factor (sigma-70 family)